MARREAAFLRAADLGTCRLHAERVGKRRRRRRRWRFTNLPRNYPVIDRFVRGVGTSIKSLDLRAATYKNPAALARTLERYVDKVAGFTGRNWANVNLAGQVTARALEGISSPDPVVT